MRTIFALASLLLAASAQAGIVTLEFDDIPESNIDIDGSAYYGYEYTTIDYEGFRFERNLDSISSPPPPFANGFSGGSLLGGPGVEGQIYMQSTVYDGDGYRNFDLHSIEATYFPDPYYLTVQAYELLGGTDYQLALDPLVFYVDSPNTVISFDGYLDNIYAVTFTSDSAPVIIDSMTVTAVPIPAAVWLFGSALAGLGWLRRRQPVASGAP